MAIILHKSANKTVNSIAERNAITQLVDHMVVTVLDAISDVNAGPGVATYRWNAYMNDWILISRSTFESMKFETEEIAIADGQVQASNIPADNIIWDISVIDEFGVIIGELRVEDLAISAGTIAGLSGWNGNKLRFTYAYGNVTQQLDTYIDSKLADGGFGDMSKSIYDANGDGIVDNAEKVNGLTVETAVPAGAVFTDTTYTNVSEFTNDSGYITAADVSNVDLTSISSSIIPDTADTYTLGSAEKPFRDLYVGANSLYVNGQQVLSNNDSTMKFSADPDQSIEIQTAGDGDITLNPMGTGNIQLKATVQMQAGEVFRTSDGSALVIDGDLTVNGNINATDLSETVTSLSLVGNVLTYTDENGSSVNYDLTTYLDDTNLARIVAGSYDSVNKELVFTRDDSSTFRIDASMFFDDTNIVTSVNGGTGAINITLSSLGFTGDTNANYYDDSVLSGRVSTLESAGYITDYTVTEADVTGHQGAISITESQISDFGSYEPADSTILKDADIGVNVQSYNVNTVIDSNYVHTDNNYTSSEKSKLAGIEAGATADQTKADIDALNIDAATVNGKTVETNVPAGAVFTDTETTTNLIVVGNELRYTNEEGTLQTVDLSLYLDDTNLSRLVSGSYDSVNKELVFTRDDSSEFRIDASMFFDDTNLVTSVSGRTGSIILTESDITDLNKYTQEQVNTLLSSKVDNGRVLTDVPAGAVFTDTTYTNVSEFTNDAGYVTAGEVTSTVEGATDTNIVSPAQDEILVYNATSGKWENSTLGSISEFEAALNS